MAFAQVTDVETRLGRTLSQAEADMVGQVITDVTGLIAEAAGKDTAWAAALSPVPALFKEICIAKSIGAGQNPQGATSQSETLGLYSKTVRYSDANPGEVTVMLTDGEERLVRRTIFGQNSATSIPATDLDDIPEWFDYAPWITPTVDDASPPDFET